MLNSKINFNRGKKKYHFDLAHNLDEYGLSIDAAFMNWTARTDRFTIKSFCEYVASKDPINLFCVPKSEFDKVK